jgi:phosphomethylpyrimidine synthase
MNIQPKPETLIPQSVTTGPLPGSRKIYHRAQGREDILVPFREIALDPSANESPDASGPYSEHDVHVDLGAGLPRLRAPWLARRAGLETYAGRAVKPEDNGSVSAEKLVPPCPAATSPRRGTAGLPVTQYEFAKAGIITEEMIFVAARRDRPWARHHPCQYQSPRVGADDHRPQFSGEGQCQYRQFGGDIFRR